MGSKLANKASTGLGISVQQYKTPLTTPSSALDSKSKAKTPSVDVDSQPSIIDDYQPVDVKANVDEKVATLESAAVHSEGGGSLVKPRLVKGGAGLWNFRLPVSFTVPSTATVVSAVIPCDVTSSVEWTSLSNLFSEYRLVGGHVAFSSGGVPIDMTSINNMLVLGYDPADGSALTSTRNGCELEQHKLFAAATVSNGAGAIVCTSLNSTKGAPLTFDFSTDTRRALSFNSSGNVNAAPGQWKSLPVAGSNPGLDGWIKPYLTCTGSASNALVGIIYYDVQVRARH